MPAPKVTLTTTDINLASLCIAVGAHLEALEKVGPSRIEIQLSNVPAEAENALLNDVKIGCRTLFSAQTAIRTAITAAMRRGR